MPGFTTGGAASLAWTAAALLTAAGADLPAENPTTADLLRTLWQFKGQKFTELGGLSGPKTFGEGQNPRLPYCLFAAFSNADDTGWQTPTSKAVCTSILSSTDPQARG